MSFETTLNDVYSKYEKIISQDEKESVSRYGYRVGDGWTKIIRNVFSALDQLGFEGEILQVKQKCGLLRIYLTLDTWVTRAIISYAEKDSGLYCESCGIKTWMQWDEEKDRVINPYMRLVLGYRAALCGYCYLNKKVFGVIR